MAARSDSRSVTLSCATAAASRAKESSATHRPAMARGWPCWHRVATPMCICIPASTTPAVAFADAFHVVMFHAVAFEAR
eukprot:6998387-Prymnesium_polylepis.1